MAPLLRTGPRWTIRLAGVFRCGLPHPVADARQSLHASDRRERARACGGAGVRRWSRRRASSLLLSGEAGAGKTTIWRTGVEQAQSNAFAVLTSRPVEPEAELAYTGLGDVLSGRLYPIGELPAPQAHALRAALMLEAPAKGAVDERAVALGFLGVLRTLARTQPVLVRSTTSSGSIVRPPRHSRSQRSGSRASRSGS